MQQYGKGSVGMFHLAPVRLWRNISIVMAVAAVIATLTGTFFADGSIVVHWSDSGAPNNSAGKWVLWVMLLLAVLSLFTHSSFLKRGPGFQMPADREMACAMSAGLVSMFSLTDITLVVYNFYPVTAVPAVGTAAMVCSLILFVMIAYIRQHNSSRTGEEK